MSLLTSISLLEGIKHLEDLSLKDFIGTVENLKSKVVTEKLDGANLWFGLDDKGFFTSREGKSKKGSRFYSVTDYPVIAAYNGFRAAHLALESKKETISKYLQPGDMIEIEILFGKQPNTLVYDGAKNYIVILRGIETDKLKVDHVASALGDKPISVTSTIISSEDGDKLDKKEENVEWHFTRVRPINTQHLNMTAALEKLKELKDFLNDKNQEFSDRTNVEVANIKLNTIPIGDERDRMKVERDRLLDELQSSFKTPIKNLLLDVLVKKVKPFLQSHDIKPEEELGVEGVVLSDPSSSDDMVKIVDKDLFTSINTFNNSLKNSVNGLVRTNDQDAPIELRGGAFGQAKIRIADLLGIRELALSSGTKKIFDKFKGATPQDTAQGLADSLEIRDFFGTKRKISAILKNSLSEIDAVLADFKANPDDYKLTLKNGKTIGISPETLKRNLTAFAETKRDINAINSAVLKSEKAAELVMALYGRTIQTLHKGSEESVRESFSLIRSINEEGDGGSEGAGDIAGSTEATLAQNVNPQPLKLMFKNGKTVVKRRRNFKRKRKFTQESILRVIENAEFATDVDDSASSRKDVDFKNLRNNVMSTDNVSPTDVSKYLDKAHELNDEVDSVTFGLEMDNGDIVKIHVNAEQADTLEQALAELLGQEDDIEEVIDQLAQTFDIVDVEWPAGSEQAEAEANAETDNAVNPDEDDLLNDLSDDGTVIDLDDPIRNDGSPEEPETDSDMDVLHDLEDPENDGVDSENPDAEDDSDMPDDEANPEDEITDDSPEGEDEPPVEDEMNPEGEEDPLEGEDEPPVEDEMDPEGEEDPLEGEDDEPNPEDPLDPKPKKKRKPKKKEESAMPTLGQKFKERLLTEKKKNKKDDADKEKEKEEAALPEVPPKLQKLMDTFPQRGERAMIVLMYALGAPIDALYLKRTDLRKSDMLTAAGKKYMTDSQFRVWVTRLMEEIKKADSAGMKEAGLQDELTNILQKVIFEMLLRIGMPDTIERIARNALRVSVRNKARQAQGNSQLRTFLRLVGENLGIDAATGIVKESAITEAGKKVVDEEGMHNVWVDEIMKLSMSLGIPEANLVYRKKAVELAIKQKRIKITNNGLVLRRVQQLNAILGTNIRESSEE